jgi:hypothetical protein
MSRTGESTSHGRLQASRWVADYDLARERAIRWLGERYLLAYPINRRGPSWGSHQRQLAPEIGGEKRASDSS